MLEEKPKKFKDRTRGRRYLKIKHTFIKYFLFPIFYTLAVFFQIQNSQNRPTMLTYVNLFKATCFIYIGGRLVTKVKGDTPYLSCS